MRNPPGLGIRFEHVLWFGYRVPPRAIRIDSPSRGVFFTRMAMPETIGESPNRRINRELILRVGDDWGMLAYIELR